MATNTWKIFNTSGNSITYARELSGLDRVYAYVRFEQWEDEDAPPSYRWSVEDGSCARVFDDGYIEGSRGLRAAQDTADAAARRLFPGH